MKKNQSSSCCGALISLAITGIIIWQSVCITKPKCSLEKFYIPALNQTLNLPGDTTLFFQLQLKNTNLLKGIYYDPLNLTFYYTPTQNQSMLGNFSIPSFYQGLRKKALKGGHINAPGLKREAVFREVSNGSAVVRVDLATFIRYKYMAWKSKRHRIIVGADVNITDQGTFTNPNKDIRLTSHSAKIGTFSGKLGNFLVVIFVFRFLA